MVRRCLDGLYLASGWLAAFFIALICALVVAQVALNLVDRLSSVFTGTAIGLTIPSYADFTGFFLASASFLALAHTFREGGHIRVTLLIGHFSSSWRKIVEIWCVAVALMISLYFCWYTLLLVHESWTYNDLSMGMVAVPLWIPQSGMLLGLLVLSIALIDEFVRVLRGRVPSYEESAENLIEQSREEAGGSIGSQGEQRP